MGREAGGPALSHIPPRGSVSGVGAMSPGPGYTHYLARGTTGAREAMDTRRPTPSRGAGWARVSL